MSSQILHFGVLLLPSYQWLDAVGPIDYLNNHSQDIIKLVHVDEATVAKAPIIKWHYVSHDLKPVQSTARTEQYPTCTYANCPPLDYLIVPGPDPMLTLPDGCSTFLQGLIASESFKALLTVCTGSLAIAQSGVLDGLHVCSNKVALKGLAGAGFLNPRVKWVGDRRWIVDGKVWSAAGITAGIDLAAEFARVHFDPTVVDIVKECSEYEPRPDQPDPFVSILYGISLT